jgi:demethylmenaquinone methyltransferase / 2-methoxy-6-polyprenyl-1,4-benzoquinol methylase
MMQATPGSGAMFDDIAPRYDLLNRLMSLGLDRSWRRALVRSLSGAASGRILDVATGTADVAIAIARAYPEAEVVGLDPSAGMLAVGRRKIEARDLSGRVALCDGDAQALPFEDDAFDAACIAFGIRNVPDRARGLGEMVRVTRPGGTVAVLELSEPRDGVLGGLARVHVRHVVPRLGAFLSRAPQYRYLQTSVAAFPAAEVFAGMMREAGLEDVAFRGFAFGAAHLYTGCVGG